MLDESTLPTALRKKLPPNLEKIRYGNYTEDDWDYPIHLYLKNRDIRVDETGSDIIKFLQGKSVLITGATGFLGKLLVEKLLRCCRDIGTIYLIVRTKKGKDPECRVKEYLDNWVFVKLSEIYPDFRDKVVGIGGDFEADGLGLSEESRKILTEKVNIIYHAAATIRFDEKLKKAVKINVKGTYEIIKLAKECKKLDVLTHVSTAYSNCHYSNVTEQFYTPRMDPWELIEICERLSSEVVDKVTPGLVGDTPNTYVFTKQIAEDLVRTESTGIPTCIQRPSIVIAAAREPIRSWVDNIYGPVGLILAGATGFLHVMLGNSNGKCSLVPADYVVNNCIAASYKTAKDRNTEDVQIFNFTSSDSNPIYWKDIDLVAKQGYKVGSTNLLTRGFCGYTASWYWYLLLNLILHTLPGHIVDFVATKLEKKPLLTKAYQKIDKYVEVLSHFTLREWTFDCTNTRNLWNSLNENDKRIFLFDMDRLDWQDYFDTYLVAMREFLLFEFLDNLEEGRAYQKRLYLISYIALFALIVLSLYFCLFTVFCFIPITIIVVILYYLLTCKW